MTPDTHPTPDPGMTPDKKAEAASEVLNAANDTDIQTILSETRNGLNDVLTRHSKITPHLTNTTDLIFQEVERAGEKVAKIPITVTFSPRNIRRGFKQLLHPTLAGISKGLNEDVANVFHTSGTFQAIKTRKENPEPPKPTETEADTSKPAEGKPTPPDGTDDTKKPEDKPGPDGGTDDTKKPEDKKPEEKKESEDHDAHKNKSDHDKNESSWAKTKKWIYKNTWERANKFADTWVNDPLKGSGPFASPLNFINFSSDKFWLWRLLGMKKDSHGGHGDGHGKKHH